MNINLTSPINQLGYGLTGLNLLLALTQNNVDVSLFPIGNITDDIPEKYHEVINTSINNNKFYDPNAPSIRIWHQHDLAQHVGSPRIGFPIFELDTFTKEEKHQLESVDKLFVCSDWAKDVIRNNGISTLVDVVPLGVDVEIFKPAEKTFRSNKTIFLNIGKWEVRKGHDIIPEIFHKAFQNNNDVQLWMVCDNVFLKPEEQHEWQNKYRNLLGDKVKFIPRLRDQGALAGIINAADCGFYPARAEGWNLDLLETMACGKHVITTEYSAHTMFCNRDNSDLIKIDDTEPAYDGKWFFKQGNWAKLGKSQVEQSVNFLRDFHKKRVDITDVYNNMGVAMANKTTWGESAKKIKYYLKQL